ncbi:MAG: beta-lactamase family protein [Phycisphaeraceae bacterium]|nr:beta-lactamase family protein [Phycisphaeraceae bacterium]
MLTGVLASLAVSLSASGAPPRIDSARPDLDRYLSLVEDVGFPGVVHVRFGDAPAYERAVGLAERRSATPNRTDTLFDCGSVAKSFTTALALRLRQAGRLSLDEPLSARLPGVPLDARGVTLEHLLRHTAGLATDFDSGEVDFESPDEVASAMLVRTPRTPAGAHYRYDNRNYTLAAIVIERAGGGDLRELLTREVFGPAGLTSTYCSQDEDPNLQGKCATGYQRGGDAGLALATPYHYGFRGATGIVTTAADLAAWTRALWSGPLLDDVSRSAMFTPGRAGYGLGWFIEPVPPARRDDLGPIRVHHDGSTAGFDASVAFWPRASGGHASVVVLSNDRFWLPTIADEIEALVTAADEPARRAVLPAAADARPEDLAALSGVYASENGERVIVEVDSRGRPGVGACLRATPLGQEALDRVFLGGPHDPGRSTDGKRIWPRAQSLVTESIFPATAEAVTGAFVGGEQNENAAAFFTDWSALVADLGAPTEAVPLYSSVRSLVDRTLVTCVEVVMPKGRRVLTIQWTGRVEKAVAITIRSRPPVVVTFEPSGRAVAGGGREFFSFRPQGIAPPRIVFGPEPGVLELLDPAGAVGPMRLTRQP